MQSQIQQDQIYNVPVKQRIEKAIEIINEVIRDIEEDEWEKLLQAIKVLESAVVSLEFIRDYMNKIADEVLEADDIVIRRIHVESLKRWVQRLA